MTAAERSAGEITGPVVRRALHLLGSFSGDHPSQTLSELARRAGIPLSTAHRLATELVTWGALERDDDGRYQVGLRLWEVAALAPRGPGLRERALPILEDLCHVTRENVQLAVREDDQVVYVERLAGTEAVAVRTRVGGRFALTATGVGLVLLAHAPRSVAEDVLAAPIPRFTARTVTAAPEVRAMLAAVRARGYAVSDRQVTDDAISVAAPVRGPAGDVVAALSIVAHAATASVGQLAPLVQTGARGVARALAAGPGTALGSMRPPNRTSPPSA